MKLARHRVVISHTTGETVMLSNYVFEKKNNLPVFTYQGLALKLR